MSKLSTQMKGSPDKNSKEHSVLRSKWSLMSILVEKMCEYLRAISTDSTTSDIVSEIAKQYEFIIEQCLYSMKMGLSEKKSLKE